MQHEGETPSTISQNFLRETGEVFVDTLSLQQDEHRGVNWKLHLFPAIFHVGVRTDFCTALQDGCRDYKVWKKYAVTYV